MKVYILFQTDVWKSKHSRVCFGVFQTQTAAISAAKTNNLFTSNSEVEVIETEINEYKEV